MCRQLLKMGAKALPSRSTVCKPHEEFFSRAECRFWFTLSKEGKHFYHILWGETGYSDRIVMLKLIAIRWFMIILSIFVVLAWVAIFLRVLITGDLMP